MRRGIVAGHVALPDIARVLLQRTTPAAAPADAARRVPVLRLRHGRWDAAADAGLVREGVGFIVLSGALLRHVVVVRTAAELLGPGDIVRPIPAELNVSPVREHWRVIDPVLLAVVGQDLTAAVAARRLHGPLTAHALRRSNALAQQLVIAQMRSVDVRLILILRHLSERWGAREAGGIVLPRFLSHATLAMLIGARRPSVTTAIGRLQEQAALTRLDDGRWLLPAPDAARRAVDRRTGA